MADIGVNATTTDKVKVLRDKLAYRGWLSSMARIELDRAEMEKRSGDLDVEERSLRKSISEHENKYGET